MWLGSSREGPVSCGIVLPQCTSQKESKIDCELPLSLSLTLQVDRNRRSGSETDAGSTAVQLELQEWIGPLLFCHCLQPATTTICV